MATFDLLRLVLVSREQTSLFERKTLDGQTLSRELWLRAVLGEAVTFANRQQSYHFIPIQDAPPGLIAGRVGRSRKVKENAPPDQGLQEIERDGWTASVVTIDPTSHNDGQKVAFEVKAAVGTSVSVMRALFDAINENSANPYRVEVNAIAEQESFWEFERAHQGEIVSITFEFVAPNMFGTHTDIDREMKELRDSEKVVTSTLTLKNPEGLQLETERVRQTVDYTMKGGGALKARTRNKKQYNSAGKIKKAEIKDFKELEHETISGMIGRLIQGVFSHD